VDVGESRGEKGDLKAAQGDEEKTGDQHRADQFEKERRQKSRMDQVIKIWWCPYQKQETARKKRDHAATNADSARKRR